MRRAAISAGLVAILLTSCGSAELPARLAGTLRDKVALIRRYAETGRPGLARDQLEQLIELVTVRLEQGVIDGGRAIEILEAARSVADRLSLVPQTSPSPAPSPSPTDERGDEGGHGEGNSGKTGKGNGDEGHGKDD